MTATSIEWTDATWNPIRGCSIVSPGCTNCYAMKQAHRFSGEGGAYEGLTKLTNGGPVWTGKVRCVPELLDQPLRWRKPRRIFVNSMSDLFHEDVPDEFIADVFSVMARAQRHTFQILTKRPERMRAFCSKEAHWWGNKADIAGKPYYGKPLPNVWLGVSCEDQKRADERVPLLLKTPAAVRFVSAEPLLEDIDFVYAANQECHHEEGHMEYDTGAWICSRCEENVEIDGIDWIIVGGESGPKARPCDFAWIRSIAEQCKAAAVPCFVKQIGSNPTYDITQRWLRTRDRKGGDPSEWPEDLRVREFPA